MIQSAADFFTKNPSAVVLLALVALAPAFWWTSKILFRLLGFVSSRVGRPGDIGDKAARDPILFLSHIVFVACALVALYWMRDFLGLIYPLGSKGKTGAFELGYFLVMSLKMLIALLQGMLFADIALTSYSVRSAREKALRASEKIGDK